jgi:hypothetical protein
MIKSNKYKCPKLNRCKNKVLQMKGCFICGYWNWTNLTCTRKEVKDDMPNLPLKV